MATDTTTRSSDRARRPFWIHQIAEYGVGLALVSLGLQAPDPLVPGDLLTAVEHDDL